MQLLPNQSRALRRSSEANGQPRLKRPERILTNRVKCLLLSATTVTLEKTLQRVDGANAVKCARLTQAGKGLAQVLGREAGEMPDPGPSF